MKNIKFLIAILLFNQYSIGFGQDDFNFNFIGHNIYNNAKLLNTTVKVLDGTTVVKELNTNETNKFKLVLPFGKTYDIYLINQKAQHMFIRVFANIPANKRNIDMTYELDIPFFPKDANRFDTTQFQKPIHQLVFNGKNRMIDDTSYSNLFLKKLAHPVVKDTVKPVVIVPKVKEYVQLAGRLSLDNDKQTLLKNKTVILINKKGEVIGKSQTTNFGVFVFQHVDAEEADGITVSLQSADNPTNAKIKLESSSKVFIADAIGDVNQNYSFRSSDKTTVIPKLIDKDFSYNVGGKLISTIGIIKKLASDKTVYLLNSKNTIVQTAKTNLLGNFLFTKIVAGEGYNLAFDTSGFLPNEYLELYTTKDKFVKRIDSISNKRYHYKFLSVANSSFNDLVIDDADLRMNVKGRIYGDNKNNPLSNFKILLMNDMYEAVDSAKTDMNGDFSFKYIPYNRQVLINDNNEKDILEALNNIMVFDNEDNVMKIVSTVKGKKFEYKLLNSAQNKMVELYSDDPWLTLLDKQIMAKKLSGSTETIVESILFELNKSELLPQSMLTLDKVILAMKTNKNFNIELGAHSDSRGGDVQNLALSEKRAISAKAYIISKGIDAKRVVAKGYGESKLLNNCGNNVKCSEDEHAENRRIEFKISYR